jgi:hypothetical protein
MGRDCETVPILTAGPILNKVGQLLGRLLDVELSIRGVLRGFGLKVGQVTRKTASARLSNR